MRGSMLQRLEFADQLSELFALAKIIQGHRRGPGGNSDELGRSAGAACGERTFERPPAGIDLADHRVGVELDVVKSQTRCLRAVDQREIVDTQARGVIW